MNFIQLHQLIARNGDTSKLAGYGYTFQLSSIEGIPAPSPAINIGSNQTRRLAIHPACPSSFLYLESVIKPAFTYSHDFPILSHDPFKRPRPQLLHSHHWVYDRFN